MSGPGSGAECESHEQGITPRATQLLFDVAKENSGRFHVEFELSMIELYRGELQDLLRGKNEKSGIQRGGKLSIKKDHAETNYVENATGIKNQLCWRPGALHGLRLEKETYCVNVDERFLVP